MLMYSITNGNAQVTFLCVYSTNKEKSEEDALSGVVRDKFSSVKNWAYLTNEPKNLVQIAPKK